MEAVNDAASSNNSNSGAAAMIGNMPPPFLSKTYDMVDDPATDAIVSWSKNGSSFVVWNVPEFARDLLPKYFKHNNFSSFVRQLNTYGFRKTDPDRWEFANEGFLRGCKHLLKNISRRKPAHGQSQQQQPQLQKSAGACVEVGKFGLEEEVEQLKRDKNVLMQELVRLRQHQQASDQQMQTVGQRVQVMEQRQQQMMSFLAKAMHSPGFLAQLVPQKNEGNMRIGGNKKRRLSTQDEKDFPGECGPTALDGQIIKYQPSMNEAAKTMCRILKMASPPSRFDQSRNNANAFLIDDVLSSNSLYSENSATQISGVTCKTTKSDFPVRRSSTAISETQSSPLAVTELEDTVLQDRSLMQGVMSSENSSKNPNVSLMGSETGNADKDLMSGVLDGTQTMDGHDFSPSPERNILMEGSPKLPSINDVFWEQFFAASPVDGDADEFSSSYIDGSLLEDPMLKLDNENEWEKAQHMDHITEHRWDFLHQRIEGSDDLPATIYSRFCSTEDDGLC